MMLPTHILIGLAFVAPVLPKLPPSVQIPAIVGIIVGSIIPDLDLVFGTHRKTLHIPIYGWVLFGLIFSIAIIHTTPITVALTTLTFGIAQHSISDVIGGGLEDKPWEQTATKAVYSHHHKAWWPPKHYITYDGSPFDLAVFGVLAALTYDTYKFTPYYTELLFGLTIVAIGYTFARKLLPKIDEYIYYNIPKLRPLLRLFHGSPRNRE